MTALTESSPDEGEHQREQDVGPVPLVLGRYGDDTQEEEDEGFWDGAQHLDNMADGGAGSLGDVLLHVVLHGDGTRNKSAGRGKNVFIDTGSAKLKNKRQITWTWKVLSTCFWGFCWLILLIYLPSKIFYQQDLRKKHVPWVVYLRLVVSPAQFAFIYIHFWTWLVEICCRHRKFQVYHLH